MKSPVMHIVGARPNFMKCAPVVRQLDGYGIDQVLIHTGQHYDAKMSEVFFEELNLPRPDVDLGVGSGSHAEQTAALVVALEAVLIEKRPALVVVYGDVNSTLAAALVASKIGIPVAHVEAGLRSFDMSMPEEINRRLTDQLCELLFVTSAEAMAHLGNEGLDPSTLHFTGNPMIDSLRTHESRFDVAQIRRRLRLEEHYAVATLHRPSNVDHGESAQRLVRGLQDLSRSLPVVVPLHPRGRDNLHRAGLESNDRIRVIEPLGYIEFMSLLQGARVVITDSGGVQEETTVLKVPCLTVRTTTERPVTITQGTNQLVEPEVLREKSEKAMSLRGSDEARESHSIPPLWDGAAGERIAIVIRQWMASAEG